MYAVLGREFQLSMTRNNITDDELFEMLKMLGWKVSSAHGYLRSVLQRQDRDEWNFMVGRFMMSDEPVDECEDLYRDHAFACKKMPFTTVLKKLRGDGLNLVPSLEKVPAIRIKEENQKWTEELIPSHATETGLPMRRYRTRIEENAYFSENQLLGFEMPYHQSAAIYAGDFLGLNDFGGHRDRYKGELLIDVTDARGAIQLHGDRISIAGRMKELYLTGQVDDKPRLSLSPGKSEKVDSKTIQNLELWLLTPENEIIDYRSSSESPHRYESQQEEAKHLEQLMTVIECGESETCEFKPYVDLNGKKADEILKTVCAFSNQAGGRLFFGIDDEGEISGLARTGLRKDFRAEEDRYSAYIKALRKFLREKLRDNQCFGLEQIDLQEETLIVVTVTRSNEPNFLQKNGQAYVRCGATNKKMTPLDIRHQSASNPLLQER